MAPKKFGRWTTIRRLGGGANGDVWLSHSDDGLSAAVKVRRRGGREAAQRFAREAEHQAALSAEGFAGVIPLIDTSPSRETPPWIAMAVAEPLMEALGKSPSIAEVVGASADIAGVLSRLHLRGVSHRDVKPENLFRLDGRCSLATSALSTYLMVSH
jgi:serine/threonine protein kinase